MKKKQDRSLGRPRKEEGSLPTNVIILRTATKLFLENGFPSVSMDEVADSCNVTKATVYYYYNTKAALFTDAMVQLMNRIKKKSVAILSTDDTLKNKLIHFAKAHLEATVDIDINSFMKEAELALSKAQLQQMKLAEKALYDELELAISKAIETGEIPSTNTKLATLIFVNFLTVRNSMDETFKQSFSSVDDLARQLVDFYWSGISKESLD